MFSKLLVSRFIKNYSDTKDEKIRESYGYLAGVVGILVNVTLFLIEITTGFALNSIAVMADAFHNLTDVISSLITIFSFRFANKPADEDHPFGHGRIEYVSAMIVSFLIIIIGLEFMKSAFDRVMHPSAVTFNLVSFILITISIPFKLWFSRFNRYLGNVIDSSALRASSIEASTDVVILSGVALSLIISKFSSLPIDGYIGIIVSLFILYSGFTLAKETLNPLLGEAPDPKLVENIKAGILGYDYISGVHDLIIHNYGPGRCMCSIHAEVPCDIPIVKIHDIIDRAEKEISKKLNIYLVIHMDPINTDNKEVEETKEEILNIINKFSFIKSIHDFRVVGEGEHKNLIFDIVVSYSKDISHLEEDSVKENIDSEIKKFHPYYNSVITVDRDFAAL